MPMVPSAIDCSVSSARTGGHPDWRLARERAALLAGYRSAPLIRGNRPAPFGRESRPNRFLPADLASSLHQGFQVFRDVLDLVLHVRDHRADEELIQHRRPTRAVDDLEELIEVFL